MAIAIKSEKGGSIAANERGERRRRVSKISLFAFYNLACHRHWNVLYIEM